MLKYILILLLSANLQAQDYSRKTLVYPFYPRESGEVYKNFTEDKMCKVGYSKSVRKVSSQARKQVFAKYGVTKGHWGEYEVDHIISLQLGGNNSINNLFPQPYEVYLSVNGKDMRMGAREKDVVENSLRRKVCKGYLTIKEAQDIILNDWITYYLKLKRKI